jgi:PD-(D/E)XK nuclease superfamily protein
MSTINGAIAEMAIQKAVVVAYTATCRHTPSGYVRSTYTAAEIDRIGLYCHELNRRYFVPIEEVAGRSLIHLRLTPAANIQEVAIKYAADYEFPGAIAQLGERGTGSAEVAGSSPASSTPNLRPLR